MSQDTMYLSQTDETRRLSTVGLRARPRVAWLFPSLWLGHYWQPMFSTFEEMDAETTVFTGGLWDNFDTSEPGLRLVKEVGKTQYHRYAKTGGYSKQLMMPSLGIVARLLTYRPKVVFSQAFSLWSLLAILLKPLGRWRVNLFIDGSSPNVDFRDSRFRTVLRRFIAKRADLLIPNSEGAKDYLVNFLGVKPNRVRVNRYLVPDARFLQQNAGASNKRQDGKVNFLYVGKLIPRKGADKLVRACARLKAKGFENFVVTVVGDGPQRSALEQLARAEGVAQQLDWRGWAKPDELGRYYQEADVFVFPTLEDIWGIVALEAMAFRCPVIGSKYAGSSEMIEEGQSGYVIDPNDDTMLTEAMQRVLESPEVLAHLSAGAENVSKRYTPYRAVQTFYRFVAEQV